MWPHQVLALNKREAKAKQNSAFELWLDLFLIRKNYQTTQSWTVLVVRTMFDVFTPVKGLIKLETICIDNNVFRLHYKATFIVLVVASLLVTSRQYIGDPIDCIVEEIPNNVSIISNLLTQFDPISYQLTLVRNVP